MEKELRGYIFRFWLKFLIIISSIIIAGYIGISLSSGWIGFHFIYSVSYGLDAVISTFIILGIVLWPLLLACLAIIIGGCIYLHSTKSKYDDYLKIIIVKKKMFKVLGIGVGVAIALFAVVNVCGYFFHNTYAGAKIRYGLTKDDSPYNIRTIENEIDNGEEIDLVLKNGEPFYLHGFSDESLDSVNPSDYEFMNKHYYVDIMDENELNKLVDLNSADHFTFLDYDRRVLLSLDYVDGIIITDGLGGEYDVWRPISD